jgi:hypothetical protein
MKTLQNFIYTHHGFGNVEKNKKKGEFIGHQVNSNKMSNSLHVKN